MGDSYIGQATPGQMLGENPLMIPRDLFAFI